MKINTITTLLFALQASTAFGEDLDCDDFGITQWPDCNSKCKELAGPGVGYSARVNGGMGNISACFCEYGRIMEQRNSFTCTRTPTFPPIPDRFKGLRRCSKMGIDDQETCFAFCEEYNRLPQYVGNDNGMLFAAAALDKMLTSILNARGIRVRICALAKNSSRQVVIEKTISSSKKRSDKSSRKTCLSSERKDYIKVIIDDNSGDG